MISVEVGIEPAGTAPLYAAPAKHSAGTLLSICRSPGDQSPHCGSTITKPLKSCPT